MAAAAAAAMLTLASTNADAEILSSKRGFADVGANYNNLQATGAGWYYTWGTGAANPGNFDAAHYPMFWSAPSQTTINNVKARNPTYVLGFNEPERPDQANMTVSQAISSWNTISNSFAGTNTKLVSPAVADTGGATGGQAWLANFMSQATAANLKVDAVAFHWYGVSNPNNPAGAASSFLSRVDSYHNSYNKPVFITEFAIHDWGGAYTDAEITEANRQFLNIVIPGLESRSYVAGYSWYHWFSDARLYDGSPSKPTPMAYSYVGAVGAGQVADIGGENLGEHVAYLTGGELTMTGATPGTVRYINALANTSSISGAIDWELSGTSSWVRIQPGATLRKTGGNRVTLGAFTVTNDGVLEMSQGVLRLTAEMAGSGSINIPSTGAAVGSTARLELSGRDITIAQPITFAQRNDPGGSDGIRNVSGNNVLSGPITIVVGGNQARIQSDAGLLTLSGGISTSATTARNLYLQGVGAGLASGVIADNPSNAAGSINLHKEGAGTWTLGGANTYTGNTNVNGGTLVLGQSYTSGSGVSVAGGATLRLAPGGSRVLKTKSLTLSGKLDLTNNDLLIDYPAVGPSPEEQVRQSVRDGRVTGATSGIFSTRGVTVDDVVLAVVDNAEWGKATFDGLAIDASTIVGKYTYFGDANLDGMVSGDDYLAVDAGLGTGTTWLKGDFNLDGAVTGDDYLAIDANLGKGTSNPLAFVELKAEMVAQHAALFGDEYLVKLANAETNGFMTAVPEPGALGLIGFAAVGLVLRRRRPDERL